MTSHMLENMSPPQPACPDVAAVFATLNAALADPARRGGRWSGDGHFLDRMLPDWDLVSCVDNRPAYGRPRVMFRHTSCDDWWLMAYSTSGIRLLEEREWNDDEAIRFSQSDPHRKSHFHTGTSDTLIDFAVRERARRPNSVTWSYDMVLWVLDTIPGERSDAERLLFSLTR